MTSDDRPLGYVVDLYVLDADGRPRRTESLREWGESQERDRRLAQDALPDGTFVSTVFLGIDRDGPNVPPLLFETAIRRGEHWDVYVRCATRAQALHAHVSALAMLATGPEEGT